MQRDELHLGHDGYRGARNEFGPNARAEAHVASEAPMSLGDFIVLGVSVVCGLWLLWFPNSVIRFKRALYGSRFVPRPFFIRLAGGVWIAVSLYMFWILRGIPK